MSGTRAGGRKAAATNKLRNGNDFYARIGAKGGRNGYGPDYKGGFGGDHELARRAGAKGGRISRRGPAKWHNTKKVIRNGKEVTLINVKYIKTN